MEAAIETKIDLSAGETEILGLKAGRCNSDNFDEKALYDQITRHSYDICRLKVPAEDEMAAARLDKMGLPAFFSGSIRRYKTKITQYPPGDYNFNDLVFEVYDGSQDKLLKDMLVGTWGTYPIGYYRTPYLKDLITKEQEIECVFQFYKKHNLKKNNPDNSIVFIKHGENYVGFFALNILNGNLESHVGGILAPYRKGGYFLDKLRYIKRFCVDNKLGHFIFGARNENAEVQRIFQYVGFEPRGSENVFHIASLLTYTQKALVITELELDMNDAKSTYKKVADYALSLSNNMCSNIAFDLNCANAPAGKNKFTIVATFPVATQNESLIVLKGNCGDGTVLTAYLKENKR